MSIPKKEAEQEVLDNQAVLEETLRAAAIKGTPNQAQSQGGGLVLDRGNGPGLLEWVFDRAAARKHHEVMSLIRDTTIETMEAMNASTLLATDFVANTLDAENTMQQIIMQYRNSELVLSSAPMYVGIAREMLMQTVPSITQAGMNRIKTKIEKR